MGHEAHTAYERRQHPHPRTAVSFLQIVCAWCHQHIVSHRVQPPMPFPISYSIYKDTFVRPSLPIEENYLFGRKNHMVQPDSLNVGCMAGETRTDCRLGKAHSGQLTGVYRDPAIGPPLPAHDAQRLPGNKGATPAVVLALFAQVALVQFWIGDHEVMQVYGIQPHHLLIWEALDLDTSWYEAPSSHKNSRFSQTP